MTSGTWLQYNDENVTEISFYYRFTEEQTSIFVSYYDAGMTGTGKNCQHNIESMRPISKKSKCQFHKFKLALRYLAVQ